MGYRRRILLIGSLLLLAAISLSGLIALFSSPSLMAGLANLALKPAGYTVRLEGIAFRGLATEVRGIEVRDVRSGAVTFAAARLAATSAPSAIVRGEIESLTLTEPRFFIQIKEGRKKSDFSALEKLPPVRLLSVQKGEFVFATDTMEVKAADVNAEVRNFSPRSGGNLKLTSLLSLSRTKGGDVAVRGTAAAEARLTALFPRPSGMGSVMIKLSSATGADIALDDVGVALPFTVTGDRLVVDRASIDVGALAYPAAGRGLSVKAARAAARLTYDGASGTMTVEDLKAEAPGLASLEGFLEAALSGGMPWKGRVAVGALDFKNLFNLMKPLLPAEYGRWQLEGRGTIEATLHGNLGPPPTLEGDCLLRFSGGGFTSADKMKAAQKLTGSATIRLRRPEGRGSGNFEARMSAGDGELLWGKYYRDLKGKEVAVEAQGAYELAPSARAEWAGTVSLPILRPVAFSGSFEDRELSLSLSTGALPHERTFELLFGDVAAGEGPLSWARVSGESSLSATLRLAKGRMRLRGRIETRDGALQAKSLDLAVKGVMADLPFELDTAPPAGPLPAPAVAYVRIGGLSRGNVHLSSLEVPLVSSLNRVDLAQQVDVPLFGGTLSVPRFQAKDLHSGSPSFDFSLHVVHVDLGELSPRASGISFEGFLDATLPSIRYSQRRWTAEGRGRVRAFGGEIAMTDLFGERLFTPARSFGGNVSFKGIDLEKLTKRIPLGRMTGVINGTLKGFRMEYGQPAAFDLTIESDTSAPGPRAISVEAVENLSIVGTGSAAVGLVLKGGLNRFFKQYPYSRIGIRCVLENDVFSVRGTIHEGGREYLIRKALFRGIDVINQNPGSSISFKDMQERIGRVFRKEEGLKRVSQAPQNCYNSVTPSGGT